MRAIVTTTINVPTGLRKWRETLNYDGDGLDMIFVVGDKKSPHREIVTFLASLPGGLELNQYIEPHVQTKWASSENIGWNCIQRRNIGFLEAALRRPDIIFTVDDDNVPLSMQYAKITSDFLTTPEDDSFLIGKTINSSTGWFNVAKFINVHHRGFPHSQRWNMDEVGDIRNEPVEKIGVVASFWSGAPDIDAIERICCDPDVSEDLLPDEPWFLAPRTWSPFNSQATAFRAELLPAMLMLPGVGRFDDIWASYITRHVMDTLGMYAAHGFPNVHQDRNPHDNIVDLKAEMFGYEYNEHVIDIIQATQLSEGMTVKEMVNEIFRELFNRARFLPEQTRESFLTWMSDLERVERATGVKL